MSYASFLTFRTSACCNSIHWTGGRALQRGVSSGLVSGAVQMAVGSNRLQSWHRGGVGLGSWEQEQKRRKRERKRGKKLWAVTGYWPDSECLCKLQPEMHIFPCIFLQLGKCRPVQFPALNYLMIIHSHVCLCALISHLQFVPHVRTEISYSVPKRRELGNSHPKPAVTQKWLINITPKGHISAKSQ